jgi:hypothetical protein
MGAYITIVHIVINLYDSGFLAQAEDTSTGIPSANNLSEKENRFEELVEQRHEF